MYFLCYVISGGVQHVASVSGMAFDVKFKVNYAYLKQWCQNQQLFPQVCVFAIH